MTSRSEAFSSYLNDIYSQYDLLLERVAQGDASMTLTTEEAARTQILGSMPEGDIEALVFLVLMQAAKAAEEDLRAIIKQMRAINQVKQRQREAMARLKRYMSENAESNDGKMVPANPCGALDADLVTQLVVVVAARQSDQELIAIADEYILAREHLERAKATDVPKDELDSLSELSELEQLRLQMIMDRRSKMIEMLSNLLKKMSETQDAVIQNLK